MLLKILPNFASLVASPQPVMSQPYPVPIPLPQPKSRPLPDSRGIPDTLNLFFFWKTCWSIFDVSYCNPIALVQMKVASFAI